MDDLSSKDDLSLLEWHRKLYENFSKHYELFFREFPFFEDLKKEVDYISKDGIELCEKELEDYITKTGKISSEFAYKGINLIKKLKKLNDKLEIHNNVVSNSLKFNLDFSGEEAKLRFNYLIFLN